jgi:DNA-binding NtrC family response regulator
MPTIAAQEKRVIIEALQRTHGHQGPAAALLGLSRFQLYGRVQRYHIELARGSERNNLALDGEAWSH